MVSTFTPNVQLEEPARGDDVGIWDTPVNANMTLIDLVLGGRTTISLNNSPVILNAAQYECKTITFNSTLTGSVTITFPTSFTKSYEIYHTCTGSSAFTITLATTAAGGQAICCPPGAFVNVLNDGTNIRFTSLERIGTYWDYAGSSVPNWVSGCTVAPYLNCDGSTFSAATYPQLSVILGSTTLPNSKGKSRFALDQGAGLISSAAGGFSGSTVGATGGAQTSTVTIGSSNLPNSIPYKDPGHVHSNTGFASNTGIGYAAGGIGPPTSQTTANTASATVGITINPSTAAAGTDTPVTINRLPPAYIGGLTLVRAG